DVDPAPLHRVGHLIEQQELVALLGDRPLDLGPPLAGLVGGLLEVLGQPRPAVAHLLPVDAAECGGGLRLADLPLARLDELEDTAAVAPCPGTHEHPESRGALALALAGGDDHERSVARLAARGVGASAVLGHAALLTLGGTRRWTRPPAA